METPCFRLLYLFVAGVEGAGHHAILSLFAPDLVPSTGVLSLAQARPVHAASRALWTNTDPAAQMALRGNLTAALTRTRAAEEAFAAGLQGYGLRTTTRVLIGPLSADGEPLSYPFGRARNALQRPVLGDMRMACRRAGVAFRALVLVRDPMACVLSRARAWGPALEGRELDQARLVEGELQRLAHEVQTLLLPAIEEEGGQEKGCAEPNSGSIGGNAGASVKEKKNNYRSGHVVKVAEALVATVQYNDLIAEPQRVAKSIALFAGLGADELEQGSASIRTRNPVALPPPVLGGLRDYFGYRADEGELRAKVASAHGWGSLLVPEIDILQVAGANSSSG